MESERVVEGIWRIRSSIGTPSRTGWPRVAILHSFYRSELPSGENQTVLRQFDWLSEAGVEVALISVATDDLIQNADYRWKTAWGVASGNGASPQRALDEFRPDVVHVHNLFPNIQANWIPASRMAVIVSLHNYRSLCASATLSRNGRDCRLCIDKGPIHGLMHRCYRNSFTATAPLTARSLAKIDRRQLLEGADALLAPSETVRRAYTSAGFDSVKVLLQPTSDRCASLTSREIGNGKLLFVGRLTHEKGIEGLLRGWPAHLSLTVIGQGPLESVAREIVRQRRLHVEFRGRVNDETLADELRAAEALVFPSTWREGAPAVYAEALSAGLPVIAVRGNAVAEFVDQDGTGVVVEELTELNIGSAVTEITLRAESLSKTCRNIYLRDYTRESWMSRLNQIYIDAVAKRISRSKT